MKFLFTAFLLLLPLFSLAHNEEFIGHQGLHALYHAVFYAAILVVCYLGFQWYQKHKK